MPSCRAAHEKGTTNYVAVRDGAKVDDEHEDVERVRDWIERLETYSAALEDVEDDNATDFANNALEALNDAVLPHLVPAKSPSMLLALEAVVAVTQAATKVIIDWADTPDVRDRYTRQTAGRLFETALDDVLSRGKSWLSEGLPPIDEVEQRIAAGAKDMQEAQETLGRRNAELEAQDAEAEADPYGAILVHLDPSRSDAPIFEKVCSLTEEEDKRYRDAYERLRKMLDSELVVHISDESDRFLDQLVSILEDLRDNKIGIFDADAWDERRRKVAKDVIDGLVELGDPTRPGSSSAPVKVVSGKIDKVGTTLTLYRDGTFTTTGMIFTSNPDRLVGFSADTDSMRRKSVTGRGAAFIATGGLSVLASNNRGVLYVTVTGELSGSKTYTSKNPENKLLSSVRSLQATADQLLASPHPPTAADGNTGGAAAAQPAVDVASQLKTLAELHASGALSDEEFAAAKARLLS